MLVGAEDGARAAVPIRELQAGGAIGHQAHGEELGARGVAQHETWSLLGVHGELGEHGALGGGEAQAGRATGVHAEQGTGPTLAVEVAPSGSGASPKTAWRVRARGFGLRLPGGQTLRVEPEEDGARIRIDQTFHPTWQTGEGALAYTTEIHAGDLVHLEGEVRREIDTRSTGRGYRDAATAWVVRAPAGGALGVVSERMIALHAQRARFHIRWALGLGGAVAALHLGLLASFHAALRALGPAAAVAKLDSMSAVHTAALAVVLVFAYHLSAEGSRPWLDRAVTRS